MKRIISLILVIAAMFPTVNIARAQELIAAAVFEKSGARTEGMSVTTGAADSFNSSVQNQKECWVLGTSKEENCYINLDIDDRNASDYQNYMLDITYLDSGRGHFSVKYVSYNGIVILDPIIFENTGEWRTVSIPLMRAVFKNGITATIGEKCDISIMTYEYEYQYSHAPVYISNVKLYDLKSEDKSDVSIISEAIDLNFFDGDTQTISYSVKNNMIDNPIKGTVTFKVIDEDNQIIWSASEPISVSKGRTKTASTTLDFQKYGVHTLKVEITDEANNIYSFGTKEVSLIKKAEKLKQKDDFGVSSHFCWNKKFIDTMPLLRNMGGKWLRDELYWRTYESVKGVYELPDWWNEYINKAIECGIEPLIILNFGNSLYTETDNSYPENDEQLEAYGNYVYNLVSDLKGRVTYFEVWNEPNLNGVEFGSQYAKMLKVAYTQAKRANPDCKIVGLVMAGASNAFMDYMEREDPDIYNYLDLMSFHEYTYGKAPENSSYVNTIKRCTNSIRNHCGTEKEIWLTEMGFAENEIGISESEAAKYGVRSVLWNDANRLYDKIFCYTWINGGGAPSYREANFGQLNEDFSAKKGYIAYAAMNHFVGEAEFADKIIDENNNYIYKYSNGINEKVSVLFNAEDKKSVVKLTPEFDKYSLYDMYGNQIPVEKIDGVLQIAIDGEPVYLVCRHDGAEMNYQENNVYMYGEIVGAAEGEQIMIYALNPKRSVEEIFEPDALVYIDQTSLGKDGIYKFKFPMTKDAGEYEIYIGYGGSKELIGPLQLEVRRDVTGSTGLFSGSNQLKTMPEVYAAESEVLSIKGIIDNRYNAPVIGALYAAGFFGGKLLWIEKKEAKTPKDSEISFDIDRQLVLDTDEIKLFLWTDTQTPISGAQIID